MSTVAVVECWSCGGLDESTAAATALWANHLKGWCIFWNWPLSGLQGVDSTLLKYVQGCCRVCPWMLQNVCRVTDCVQDAVLTSSLAHQD